MDAQPGSDYCITSGVPCTTCYSAETPSFEVCKENDGNASVNGQTTGTPYDIYISGLEQSGIICEK